MALLTTSSARSIVLASAAYFLICGLSAIFLPVSWLWISGLPTQVTNELQLTFGVIGAYMLALAVGSLLCWLNLRGNSGLLLTLAAANALDFLVTLKAVVNHSLPLWNGVAFMVVAIVWATLLTLAWRASRHSGDETRTD
jgi:hypothetical protein